MNEQETTKNLLKNYSF